MTLDTAVQHIQQNVNVVENDVTDDIGEALIVAQHSAQHTEVNDDTGEALIVAKESTQDTEVTDEEPLSQKTSTILEDGGIQRMLNSIKSGKKSKKDWNITVAIFLRKFVDAKTIDKSFTKYELLDCLSPVLGKLAANGIKISASTSKKEIHCS